MARPSIFGRVVRRVVSLDMRLTSVLAGACQSAPAKSGACRPMLEVRRLVMLRAVDNAGSITAAARTLGYTRSAVSQQLSALETEVGASLVERRGNRVHLTRLGRRLVEYTERILVELQSAQAMLDRTARSSSGLLRVGLVFGEGPSVASNALRQLKRKVPGLEIQLVRVSNESAPADVISGDLDVALVSRFGLPARRHAGLHEWTVGVDQLCVCIPQGHRLSAATLRTMSDLRDESWILSSHTDLGRLTTAWCAAAGFEPISAVEVDEVRAALDLVAAGWGITIAPAHASRRPYEPFIRIPILGPGAARRCVMIVRHGEQAVPLIALAADAFHESATRGFDPPDSMANADSPVLLSRSETKLMR